MPTNRDKPLKPDAALIKRLGQCHPGVGLVVWNAGNGEIHWNEFFHAPKDPATPLRIADRQPLLPLEFSLDIDEDN
jgi:hypothetical protein